MKAPLFSFVELEGQGHGITIGADFCPLSPKCCLPPLAAEFSEAIVGNPEDTHKNQLRNHVYQN